MLPTGTLVWAKQRTHPPWPAIVAPNVSGITEKTLAKKKQIHVIFLEYDNQHAWVPSKDVAEFTGAEDDIRNCKRVETAMYTAIGMMEIDTDDRLTMLNTGRPVIRGEGATNMQREVGRNDEDDVSHHENDEAVAVNNNGRKKARVDKSVNPNMPDRTTFMQHEVRRNDGDVSDHDNTEAVTVNTNGKKTARVEDSVNTPEKTTSMQSEADRNDGEEVSDSDQEDEEESSSDEESAATAVKNVKKRKDTCVLNPFYGRKRVEVAVAQVRDVGNQTRENTGQDISTKNVKISIGIEMAEETWLKTVTTVPNFFGSNVNHT